MAHQKERILYTLKLLMDHTDSDREYTMKSLLQDLAGFGFRTTDKTVREDIEALIGMDFPIIVTNSPGRPSYYSYAQPFDGPELKMLIDAVLASRFISEKDSRHLVSKLEGLSNRSLGIPAAEIDEAVRSHTRSSSLYTSIQNITEAIRLSRKIRYQYYDYDLSKKRIKHNQGEVYTYSPYGFAWDEDHYYLLGQMDKRPGLINPVRVDLMCNIKMLEESAVPAPSDFHTKGYGDTVFRMFGGEETTVVLESPNDLIRQFVDRFGEDFEVTPVSDSIFRATVRVAVSPTFFSWVFQYGGRIRIVAPDLTREAYLTMLSDLLSSQKKH